MIISSVRSALLLLIALSGPIGAALAQEAQPSQSEDSFSFEQVVDLARRLSEREAGAPDAREAPQNQKLSYDEYRRITFVREREDFRNSERFRLQYAPRGFLFDRPIEVSLVEDGTARPRPYDPADFRFYDLPLDDAAKANLGFAGLKLLTLLNEPAKFDEVVSFQGASFFRALGVGNRYGASARGLALGTAAPDGEEFPVFTRFWVERPSGDGTVRFYALLEGPSVTGAYALTLTPGLSTVIDVEARLFPRRDIERVGIAPLTSMFEFGPQDPLLSRPEFRPAVHDSEALAIELANGERVYRPLVNPSTLQISSFANETPRGFGLLQRERAFSAYEDLEARYDLRPSVWIEPVRGWGDGRLVLVEIPTANEFNDNIVAFWQPSTPWKKGQEVSVAYRMHWGMNPEPMPSVAEVTKSRVGRSVNGGSPHFVIDYEAGDQVLFVMASPVVTSSRGRVTNVNLVRNDQTGGVRLTFDLVDVEGDEPIELRAVLRRNERQVSETWLYRWTAR